MSNLDKIEWPTDPKQRGKVVEARIEHEKHKLQRGLMGRLLGTGSEKPANLVGLAILLACAMVLLLCVIPMPPDVPRRELITLFATIVPGAMGYYFGFLTASKPDASGENA